MSPKTRRLQAVLTLVFAAAWTIGFIVAPAFAQQRVHEEYTKKILEFTTDPCFITKYVNYLPYAEGVPTPLEVLGHRGRVIGVVDLLGVIALKQPNALAITQIDRRQNVH